MSAWTTRLALVCVLLGSASSVAWGLGKAGSDQVGELYSIEPRNIMGSHELLLAVGALPKDAFETGLTLQASYAYHFSQLFAWEVVGGTYSFNLATDLSTELRNRFEVQPEREGILEAILHTNLVFKPLYGKIALLNSSMGLAEVFFVIGPAIGFFDDQSRPFGINAGVGLRFFLGRYFSLRLDIRDYAFLPNFAEVDNHFFVSFGLSLTFGFGDDDAEED
ncbi:MAG: outer membrane beta-barrel domain-containing protein [Deltaproteobacteria bacterium]|nr:outer membrane beta-barrel domain-containing protein [Deltaproteobacteria bacterium]